MYFFSKLFYKNRILSTGFCTCFFRVPGSGSGCLPEPEPGTRPETGYKSLISINKYGPSATIKAIQSNNNYLPDFPAYVAKRDKRYTSVPEEVKVQSRRSMHENRYSEPTTSFFVPTNK